MGKTYKDRQSFADRFEKTGKMPGANFKRKMTQKDIDESYEEYIPDYQDYDNEQIKKDFGDS